VSESKEVFKKLWMEEREEGMEKYKRQTEYTIEK
jgi:hypothetical protein